jgi:hypothetical protein
MTNTQSPHQRSHPYQHSSTPPVVNTSQHRIIQHPVGHSVSSVYNASVNPPSFVTQNSDQSKSVGGLQSASSPQLSTGGLFSPADWSNCTMTSSSCQVAPFGTGSQPASFSQEVVSQDVVSQNIPSHFNQSNQQQRIGTSHLPPNIHPQNLESSSNQENFDGRSEPSKNLSAGVSCVPSMQTSPSVTSGPPLQLQPLFRQGTGLPHHSLQGENSTMSSPVPRTNARSFVPNQLMNRPAGQSGPGFGVLPMPGPPVCSSTAQQPLRPSPMGQHMTQPGIQSPKGTTQTQPGIPPVTGDVQKPPSSMGYPQSPMPNQFPVPPGLGTAQHGSGHHFGKRYPQQVSWVLAAVRLYFCTNAGLEYSVVFFF